MDDYKAWFDARNKIFERLGLKRVVYSTTFLLSVAYFVYFGAGLSLVPSVVSSLVGAFLFGVWMASSNALGLLQEKTYRGSMMSLNAASVNLGGVIGALIGGYTLIRFGYLGLGSVTSFLGVVASVIYYLWVGNE